MKRIALLLTLCLVVTMLPGIGFTESDETANAPDIQIEDQPAQEELALELTDDEVPDAILIDGDLDIDLEAPMDLLVLGEDVGEIPLQADDGGDTNGEDAGDTSQAAGDMEAEQNPVTPHVDSDGPQLEKNIATVGIEDFFYLNAILPDGVEGDAISYMSSDSSIAKVYKSGRVTGVAEGFACITAAAENGSYSECFVYVKKAPVMVSFGVDSVSIGVGEEYGELKVILGEPAEEYGGTYTLVSENKNVAKVKSGNIVKGVKAGTTRIKVETYNGLKGTLEVNVQKKPDKVTLSVDKATLGVGESGKVSYKLPKNTGGTVTFSSDNPDIVSVDSTTGAIVGLAVGKAVIRGTTYNGKTDSVTVKVLPAPTAVSFDSDIVKLGVGMELKVAASLNEGSAGAITYKVKNTELATSKGNAIKGVKKGKTVLTAKTYNGLTAECELRVVAKPTKVTLPYSTLDIGVKQTVKLEPDVGNSASTYTFSSSNSKVVKVDKGGTITGVKKGSATITVKTYNDKKFKLKVNVVKAPGSVELSPESLKLSVGETAALSWSFPKGTAAGVTFTSSDADVADVDSSTGVVTGISAGDAVITVTTSNGKSDATKVTVLSIAGEDTVTGDHIEIGVSQKYQLNMGVSSPLTYKSGDEKIATVSAKGVVTGVRSGETTITVSGEGQDVVAQIAVSVLPAPKSVKFNPSSMTLSVGDSVLLMPVITEGSATGLTYSSSDTNVASVSRDGMLTALSGGKATITVTTSNGLKAKLEVTVDDPLYPQSAELTNAPSSMKVGQTLQLKWKVTPSGASVDFKWESSDASVAYVDDSGVLTAVNWGSAEITARSKRNSDIVLNFKVNVEAENLVLTIPERITGTSGIQRNLEKIDAIRVAAIAQIDALQAGGKITSSDASKRKSIVNNAFKDYAFPWMTNKKQLYWKKANSEGGAKDFKTGKVYYGVPYTSGSSDRREYNVKKLLDEGYYYDSGKGYYVLDQSKFSGRNYRGNDCSCFVDAAIWGINSSHSNDRTKEIAKSSAYKTIKGYDNMRTGDLICKGGNHVVMFLYYVNAEKTKIMIIENGGIEAGTNTVHCVIMNVKWYSSRSYKVRRLKSLG